MRPARTVAIAGKNTLLALSGILVPRIFANIDCFGFWMASLGDVNRDGVPELLVGAPGRDVEGRRFQGQAFLFSGADGTLLRTLNDPTPQAFAQFGRPVAALGDFNGDGVPRVAVGAPWQDVGGCRHQGQLFIFNGADGTLLRTLNHPNPQPGAYFGRRMAALGDLDGDGVPEIAVGATGQDVDGCSRQGQVFIFSGADGTLLRTLNDPIPQAGARFGRVIASIGDVNGDGVPEIAVGAPHQDVHGRDQGQVFIFSGMNGALLLTIDAPPMKRSPGFIERAISTRYGALR